MDAYSVAEIVVGAVIRLDPSTLRGDGTARTTAGRGNAVTEEPHYFLVLQTDGAASAVLAPLYSRDNAAHTRVQLSASQKGGSELQWLNEPSHLDPHQFWSAPYVTICKASTSERTIRGARNSYDTGAAAAFYDRVPPLGGGAWRTLSLRN